MEHVRYCAVKDGACKNSAVKEGMKKQKRNRLTQ
jgi:hypothetical protein